MTDICQHDFDFYWHDDPDSYQCVHCGKKGKCKPIRRTTTERDIA